MSKGSGGTRAKNSSTAHMGGGKSKSSTNSKSAKFVKAGNGNYQLDTPKGGGQILVNSSSVNKYKYGTKTVYEAQPWSSSYKLGQKKYFTSKKDAESYIKSQMK